MGVQGHIVDNSHALVPSSVQLIKLAAEQVIETGGVEAAGIDIVELGYDIRIAEVKLLIQRDYLSNELCSLCSDINFH